MYVKEKGNPNLGYLIQFDLIWTFKKLIKTVAIVWQLETIWRFSDDFRKFGKNLFSPEGAARPTMNFQAAL